ncbi:MAG: gephyrin-like molybdotransferase Glp [Saprospiraceae bacterium]
MLSIHQAKQVILNHTFQLDAIYIPIIEALNYTLSKDIHSPMDLPPFPQSSMDGYAFAFKSLHTHQSLEVKHIIAAGDDMSYSIQEGEAVRIFTGAPIPPGADTVVMQEKTEIKEGRLYVHDALLTKAANYRNKGSEIKAGDLALSKGTKIGPAAIGFLASMGLAEIEVYRTPSVSILVTGDELSSIGRPLHHGQVYDSNSYTLIAAFKQAGISDIRIHHIPDQIDVLKKTMEDALHQTDVLVLTGGVSVGDFDFVTKAAESIGIQTIFHKIKQKPGKPMYFGTYDPSSNGYEKHTAKFVFGLPGNPASALTCFYEYIEPALKKMTGTSSGIRILQVPITVGYKKTTGLTHFLKAWYDGQEVTPLDAQESFRLKSFATTNSLIVVPEEVTELIQGQSVEIHVLP